jgi:Glyoxalase-like domain
MGVAVQVTFDAADPGALAAFWAEALGYVEQAPPDGFATWDDWAREQGIPEELWSDSAAIVDPDGSGPRVFFQRVPEGKTAKNRVHLDVRAAPGLDGDARRRRLAEEADRLIGLGATRSYVLEERGQFWITMQNPEGNEFCLD